MTKSKRVGRGRKGIPRGPYSVKNGMKLCKGPLHKEGGEWLPATANYFFPRRSKAALTPQFLSVCKRCRRFKQNKSNRTEVGYVPIAPLMPVLRELENRLGRRETARRTKIGHGRLKLIFAGKQKRVERQTAIRIIAALDEVRAKREYRDTPQLRIARRRKFQVNQLRDAKNAESIDLSLQEIL